MQKSYENLNFADQDTLIEQSIYANRTKMLQHKNILLETFLKANPNTGSKI